MRSREGNKVGSCLSFMSPNIIISFCAHKQTGVEANEVALLSWVKRQREMGEYMSGLSG